MLKSQRIIFYLFAALLFFVPLVLWPYTSEVFEFNKIVLVYALTIVISAAWLSRCITEKQIIFRRTILDIPLLVFLGSQVMSTILSIDPHTSVFGYYSRFNGGLLSTISYLLLYWAFVSNFEKKDVIKLINYSLLPSAFIVAVYGVLEHFGIDKHLWVQDVQSRVFSTLGQPNWLAAWVVALIPLCWAGAISKFKFRNFLIYLSLSILFFTTLLFTKSRSGLVGFVVADIIFWGLVLAKKFKKFLVPFVICNLSFVIFALLIGTQFTPNIQSLINQSTNQPVPAAAGPALETGGTESGTIRKIVWEGALRLWKNYPIFGTGLETFAYSYYLQRPIAHNITSEWDYIYNKAHNEFLNIAANSGTVGLLAYLVMIFFFVIQIYNLKFKIFNSNYKLQISNSETNENNNNQYIRFALLAGFVSLSVSNFFGFSVVPTQLLFFLFPAFTVALTKTEEGKSKNEVPLNSVQKIANAALLLFTFYFLVLTYQYWYADTLYAKAKAENAGNRPDNAVVFLERAITLVPKQSIYHAEVASSYSTLAMAFSQTEDSSKTTELSNLAEQYIQTAVGMSPANINLRRQMFGVYVRLSTIDEKHLATARGVLLDTINLAPTDPKLYYNLGIADANLGAVTEASLDFQKAIELKPNYTDARIQYAALLVHLKKNDEAKKQLEYILANIDPKNTTARQALENIR